MAKTPGPASTSAAKFLRRGKVKEVYEISPNELEFRFTNDISVFDKHIPSVSPLCGISLGPRRSGSSSAHGSACPTTT